MAEALGRVARHYPSAAAKIGAKGIDMANLVSVFVGIYGTRVMMWKMERPDRSVRSSAPSDGSNVESFPNKPRFQ